MLDRAGARSFAFPEMGARAQINPWDDVRADNPAVSMAWTTSPANSALVAATAWCGTVSQADVAMQISRRSATIIF